MKTLEAGVRPQPVDSNGAAARAQAGEPLAVVESRIVSLNPIDSGRVRQKDSLSLHTVLANFAPNSIAGYGYGPDTGIFPIHTIRTDTGYIQQIGTNGSTHELGRAEDLGDGTVTGLNLNTDAPDNVRGLWTVVKSPYVDPDNKERHIMTIDLGKDVAPTLVDIPRPILEAKLETTANVLTTMQETNGNVCWGTSNSPFSMNGRNLQSVLWPHEHMFDMGLVTPENARAYRQNHDQGDNGLTERFGNTMAPRIEAAIPEEYRNGAEVQKDKKGFTLLLEDFTPAKMAEPEFIDKFLDPLYTTLQDHIAQTHEQLFTSRYQDVADTVNTFKKQGSMNSEEEKAYNDLFTLKPVADEDALPDDLKEMRKLHKEGNLKSPMGVAIGILLAKDGRALLAVSSVYKQDEPFGPAELFGVRVNRKEMVDTTIDGDTQYQATLYEGIRTAAITK